jgi:tetratricopeptide (TPR) repeat protein
MKWRIESSFDDKQAISRLVAGKLLLGESPLNISGMHRLAVALFQLEEYSECLKIADKVTQLDPTFPRAYFTAAMALRRLGGRGR